ncbi:MAG: N-acetylglucosamine-6-phosphate deacetylase [Proteobacteria bacterium]|nr:N-acetylglucosamine-6-phosphate deacetylase [Pseudomonadota bacterium]
MAIALANAELLLGDRFVAGRTLLIKGGRVEAVLAADDARLRSVPTEDLAGLRLVPGFVDIQVNGGGGVLFNDAPSVEGIRAIGAAHRAFGTTGFLPTIISDDLDTIARAVDAVEAAIAAGVPGVLGIHIEGPFLNPDRRGVHDPRHLRELSAALVPRLRSLRGGRTLLTVAPERTTPEIIGELAAAGVIVAAGHSNATFAQVTAAIAQGLRGFTHLFNAMSQLTPREPGMVGAALYSRDTWCGIIVDGHHVDPMTLRIALRCKPRDRFLLVTDAMPPVGSPARTFSLQGRTIRVVDGVCRDERGTLAGTALDMASAVRNSVGLLGVEPVDALRMASEYPANFLGIADLGRIEPGARASLAALDDALQVRRTWIDGWESA